MGVDIRLHIHEGNNTELHNSRGESRLSPARCEASHIKWRNHAAKEIPLLDDGKEHRVTILMG